MDLNSNRFYTAFHGHKCIAAGSLFTVTIAVKHALEGGASGQVLVFDDRTGDILDVDARGSDEDIAAGLMNGSDKSGEPGSPRPSEGEARGRGRPKLGVVPREVTLLPRHWEWLATQPGGASVTLRKLVEEARRASAGKDGIRKAQERTHRFMWAAAGDLPGFEEAGRALFANNRERFSELIAEWPKDVRDYAFRLAFSGEKKGDS